MVTREERIKQMQARYEKYEAFLKDSKMIEIYQNNIVRPKTPEEVPLTLNIGIGGDIEQISTGKLVDKD